MRTAIVVKHGDCRRVIERFGEPLRTIYHPATRWLYYPAETLSDAVQWASQSDLTYVQVWTSSVRSLLRGKVYERKA